MLKLKLANVVVTGLLVGAGTAYAAGSVFPSSAPEVPGAWYAESIQSATVEGNTGAMQPVFPSAAREHGPATESSYVDTRATRVKPTMAGRAESMFPTSANETGPAM